MVAEIESSLVEKHERCCDLVGFIERKLQRSISEGRRDALLYQLQNLKTKVIPKLAGDLSTEAI